MSLSYKSYPFLTRKGARSDDALLIETRDLSEGMVERVFHRLLGRSENSSKAISKALLEDG